MIIVINGATSLVGRNLLIELILGHINNLDELNLIILGRKQNYVSLRERIIGILNYEGIFESIMEDIIRFIGEKVIFIDIDLSKDNLDISKTGLKLLKSKKIDLFYHVAALSDFRINSAVVSNLENINVRGTSLILELVKQLKVDTFCFVGTAYTCGKTYGKIPPDYINPKVVFRNHYEKTKLISEMLVRDFERKSNVRCLYFRLSIVCGRLITKPYGVMYKFDVFYDWLVFSST